jgi:hypothetical protein
MLRHFHLCLPFILAWTTKFDNKRVLEFFSCCSKLQKHHLVLMVANLHSEDSSMLKRTEKLFHDAPFSLHNVSDI